MVQIKRMGKMGHSWAYLIKITDVLPVLLCITLSSTHYRLSEHDMTYGFGVWAMGWVLINPGRVGETDISCFTPHVGQAERPTKGWSGEPLWIPAASLLQQWWPELHTYWRRHDCLTQPANGKQLWPGYFRKSTDPGTAPLFGLEGKSTFSDYYNTNCNQIEDASK